MPSRIAQAEGRCGKSAGEHASTHVWRKLARCAPPVFMALTAGSLPVPALAQALPISSVDPTKFSSSDVLLLAIFIGALGAALFSAAWLIRERGKIASENLELKARLTRVESEKIRASALLDLSDQRIVFWSQDRKPELLGNLPAQIGAPDDRGRFLAFGRWLEPNSAARVDREISELKASGRAFNIVVETMTGARLEVRGRSSAAGTAVRFIALLEQQRQLAETRMELERQTGYVASLKRLLNVLSMPFWLRNSQGRLDWVNRAYAEAVEMENSELVCQHQRELLTTQTKEAIRACHLEGLTFERSASTVVHGDRRVFEIFDVAGSEGSAGIATDISEVDLIRRELDKTLKGHAETLDQLTTAVAIFDSDEKLRFFNNAYQKLWGLETAFLESAPDNNLVLDRLRAAGMLSEQPEWRKWKESVLEAYRSPEPREHWWHLPDGRTIRVVSSPHHNGGVTWVFENLTERIDLESRYNAAIRVQRETLDNLAEGVVVFGPDGKIRLSNPAFGQLWALEAGNIKPGTHISQVRALCESVAIDSPWDRIVSSVTGFDEERNEYSGHTRLKNGSTLNFAVAPLPNGQVMTTFVDATDTVNVERALMDKNEALLRADRIKNDFLHHVSYELRSPLTNIIGFTELLLMSATGPLNGKQAEYIEHIGSSSSVLLSTVNDILDLATVDAGVMQLDLSEISVEATVAEAAAMVGDRLSEHRIRLEIHIADDARHMRADDHRVRQVLTNLLSNAVNFAPEGSTVTLQCIRQDSDIVFSVHDDGPGMSGDVLDAAFRRFEPRSNGGRRRGAGLGLSIVKSFVELHGGTVEIETGEGCGTTVRCRFPVNPKPMLAAAE